MKQCEGCEDRPATHTVRLTDWVWPDHLNVCDTCITEVQSEFTNLEIMDAMTFCDECHCWHDTPAQCPYNGEESITPAVPWMNVSHAEESEKMGVPWPVSGDWTTLRNYKDSYAHR